MSLVQKISRLLFFLGLLLPSYSFSQDSIPSEAFRKGIAQAYDLENAPPLFIYNDLVLGNNIDDFVEIISAEKGEFHPLYIPYLKLVLGNKEVDKYGPLAESGIIHANYLKLPELFTADIAIYELLKETKDFIAILEILSPQKPQIEIYNAAQGLPSYAQILISKNNDWSTFLLLLNGETMGKGQDILEEVLKKVDKRLVEIEEYFPPQSEKKYGVQAKLGALNFITRKSPEQAPEKKAPILYYGEDIPSIKQLVQTYAKGQESKPFYLNDQAIKADILAATIQSKGQVIDWVMIVYDDRFTEEHGEKVANGGVFIQLK